MAAAELRFAILDPDSAPPRGCALFGYFVDGKRVSMRQACDAHRRGESVVARRLPRAEIELTVRTN